MQSSFYNPAKFTIGIVFLLGLFVASCCPPNCPCPPYCEFFQPAQLNDLFVNGEYEELLKQANIALDNETPYRTETLLYRGLAFRSLEETASAFEDFSYVFDHKNELTSIDQDYETDLLYRNYMVVSILMEKYELGDMLRDVAVDLGYTPKDVIIKEYEDAYERTKTH